MAQSSTPALPLLKEADFRRALKSDPTGGYLFFGEEDYMKTTVLRMAREAVCPPDDPMACFNDIRMDGLDFSPSALLDALTAPPIESAEPIISPTGGARKIITVTGLNFDTMRSSDLDNLCEVLEAIPDYPYALVILSAGADALDPGNLPKRPSERLTTLCAYLRPVWFEKNTPAKLYGWVQKHYRHSSVEAPDDVCRFTVTWCGRNMYTLAGEIDKVAFYALAHGRQTVTADDIRVAATPAMEYDAFAFTNAIMEHRREDALTILHDLKFRRVEPLMILSEVSRVIVGLTSVRALADAGKTAAEISATLKMHEYQVGLYLRQSRSTDPARLHAAVTAAAQADRSLKRSAGDGYAVIERLICGL